MATHHEMCGIQCGEGKHKKFYGKAMYPWALAAFATGALSVLFIVIDVVVHQYRNTKNIIETEYLTLFSAGMTLVSYQFTTFSSRTDSARGMLWTASATLALLSYF